MKASIKFREEKNPLFRAKIPLNILSFPFQSGIVAAESKELSLNLSTFFDSGPTFKFSYRPNDSQNPFSLVCKTGIGHFGSPISSNFTMSAEFNFVQNQNPTFFIHFKPKFGDFSVKKSHSSTVLAKITESKSADECPVVKSGYFEESGLFPGAGKIRVLPMETKVAAAAATGMMESVFSGTEVTARTVLPLKNRALVNFRWGLRFPTADRVAEVEDGVLGGKNNGRGIIGISFKKFPMLLMDKISIEHVSKEENSKDSKTGSGANLAGSSADVAELCLNVKKQLEIIQAENGLLRKALDDVRSGFAAGKLNLSTAGGGRDRRSTGSGDRRSSDTSGKGMDGDVNEELKKALMGATGA